MARKPSHLGSYSQRPSVGSASTALASIGSIGAARAALVEAAAVAADDFAFDADAGAARGVAMFSFAVAPTGPSRRLRRRFSAPRRQGNGHAIIARAMAPTA